MVDPNCPEPTGLFSEKSNCSVFYQCEHGVAYTKLCSSPLVFNPEKKVCDWPDNVDCGKGKSNCFTQELTIIDFILISKEFKFYLYFDEYNFSILSILKCKKNLELIHVFQMLLIPYI